ncbi:MAG TPA: zinc metalloprotease HtpX [Miltoncostaeaceae bacterium]|nr:zinc metalloprotease HtpX [Miltoncostaeaceae bacterium]
MARRWYGRDRGLTTRMTLTLFGLGLVYVIFIAALIAAGGGAVLVLVIAAAVAVVQLLFGDKLALRSMGAHVTEPHEAPELHAMIERLCQLADLPKPKVAVARTELPNAFAAGHNRASATVCVTTGLMERLDGPQLEGVIAHELSHIANRDVVVMTVAGFLATVAGLLVRMGVYTGMGRGNRNGVAIFAVVVVVSVAVYVLSFLLLRALSRYREFAADRGAAIITGAPAQLASALAAISGTMERVPTRDLRAAEGMNAFFIIPAVSRGFSLSSLVSTHPPVEKRIERLMAMQATMDATPTSGSLAP